MAFCVLRRLCVRCKYEEKLKLIKNPFIKNIEINFQRSIQTQVKHYQYYLRQFKVEFKNSQRMFSTQGVDPYSLVKNDLNNMFVEIREELRQQTQDSNLLSAATYYFDGEGKAVRPMIIALMARAINSHMNKSNLLPSQRKLAMIIEMAHTSSLVHDDIVDNEHIRRGKPSINVVWNEKQVVMAGNYILAVAFNVATRLNDANVIIHMSRLVSDIIQGELIQEGLIEEKQNFSQYLNKTNLKTASLFSNSLKAVTGLAGANRQLSEIAFEYGRNIGMVYQLIDDLLDFVESKSEIRGKPTSLDLKSGLATAPVYFASEQFPELNVMIMRRFEDEEDVEKAYDMVHKSKGLDKTRDLAKKYCLEAVRLANYIQESPYQKGLVQVPQLFLHRVK